MIRPLSFVRIISLGASVLSIPWSCDVDYCAYTHEDCWEKKCESCETYYSNTLCKDAKCNSCTGCPHAGKVGAPSPAPAPRPPPPSPPSPPPPPPPPPSPPPPAPPPRPAPLPPPSPPPPPPPPSLSQPITIVNTEIRSPSVSERQFVMQSSAAVTMEIDGIAAKELAQDQSFIRNVEYAIAAGLRKVSQDVQVAEIIVQGRRLMEDSDTSPSSGQRLKSSMMNIKYSLYLAGEDDVSQMRTKLSQNDMESIRFRADFASTLGVELGEMERARGRDTVVSSVSISTAVEVENRTTSTSTTTWINSSEVTIMNSEEGSAETAISEGPTTTQEHQMVLAVGACVRQCWDVVLVIALAVGTPYLF